MRKLITLVFAAAFILGMFLLPTAYAQPVAQEAVQKVADASNSDVVQAVLDIVKLEQKTPLAVAFLLVQAILFFLNAPMSGELFKKLNPEIKLLVIAVLTAIFGVLASMYLGGQSLGNSVMDSFNLYLIKIGLHQLYKKFYAKST